MEIEKLLKDSWEIFQKNISAIWIGTILTMPFTMLMLVLALPMVTGAKPEMNVQDATVSEI